MGFKPSAPVSYEAMLADQASRNHGLIKPSGNMQGFSGEEYEGEYGNPYFTSSNMPSLQKTTASTRNPFVWGTGNESLETAYKNAYDSYYQGSPATTTFTNTWQGPEIRPTYGADNNFGLGANSTGLQNIGTADYWQDNNANQVFNQGTDDYLPEVAAGNAVAQETNQPQAASNAVLATPSGTGGFKNRYQKGLLNMFSNSQPTGFVESDQW